jgi:UDP-2,3-diacylglucosamine hydrolase
MPRGRILFVSDLHLDASLPAAIEQFIAFLRTEASNCSALYILGDLFETWIGDDDDDPARARVRAALAGLTAGGVPCFIMHGNRDFLMGARFMAATGCRLLPDPAVLECGGRRFVLTHGDLLCTGDHAYQRFRRVARNALVQACWRVLPLALRRRMASMARRRSRSYTRQQPRSIMDVTPAAVASLLRATRCDVMIHGHTHRPATHHLEVDGRGCTRIVLGDWYGPGSYLALDEAGNPSVASLPAAAGGPE